MFSGVKAYCLLVVRRWFAAWKVAVCTAKCGRLQAIEHKACRRLCTLMD